MTSGIEWQQSRHRHSQRKWRAIFTAVALALTLYLVTAHAPHFFDDRTHSENLHAAHVALVTDLHASSVGIDHDEHSAHCALLRMLVPRFTSLENGAPLALWHAPFLLLAAVGRPLAATNRILPRPPGPTRQAILHCFRL
jgi:hypothetical protein